VSFDAAAVPEHTGRASQFVPRITDTTGFPDVATQNPTEKSVARPPGTSTCQVMNVFPFTQSRCDSGVNPTADMSNRNVCGDGAVTAVARVSAHGYWEKSTGSTIRTDVARVSTDGAVRAAACGVGGGVSAAATD
jgi:hypothetical protein